MPSKPSWPWLAAVLLVDEVVVELLEVVELWVVEVEELLPQPLTVMSTNFTNYINLSGLSALSGSQPIHLRVVGFILINPAANNTPVMVARSVEALNN